MRGRGKEKSFRRNSRVGKGGSHKKKDGGQNMREIGDKRKTWRGGGQKKSEGVKKRDWG
jgi:hypothetical protein